MALNLELKATWNLPVMQTLVYKLSALCKTHCASNGTLGILYNHCYVILNKLKQEVHIELSLVTDFGEKLFVGA